MSIKHTIKAEQIVSDIREGMTDLYLMARYDLSPRELESVIAHLVDSGLMTTEEIEEHQQFLDTQSIRLLI